jgi:hypothetical protein
MLNTSKLDENLSLRVFQGKSLQKVFMGLDWTLVQEWHLHPKNSKSP